MLRASSVAAQCSRVAVHGLDQRRHMLGAEGLGHPDHLARAHAGRIGEDLAEVGMVGLLQLVLDDDLAAVVGAEDVHLEVAHRVLGTYQLQFVQPDQTVRRIRARVAKLEANPSDLSARLELARHYQKAGFPEIAVEHGRLAVERAPESADAQIALAKLLRDPLLGPLVVPIVPDEARTFGMEALFRAVGIYAHQGQVYEPVDRDTLLYYKEATDGQILEEGITEALTGDVHFQQAGFRILFPQSG